MAMVKKTFIQVNEMVKNLDGDIIKFPKYKGRDEKGEPITEDIDTSVGLAITNALNGVFEGQNKGMSMGDKLDRFNLACKIHGKTLPVEITEKEKELILKLVNDSYPSPIMVARINEFIVTTEVDDNGAK